MADIKRFTGYIAPDGSTHDTLKKATEHTQSIKIKEALHIEFSNLSLERHGPSAINGFDGIPAHVESADMAMFLYENMNKILACYDQKAILRAPRKPKKKMVNDFAAID